MAKTFPENGQGGKGFVHGDLAEMATRARAARTGDASAKSEFDIAKTLQTEGKNVYFQDPAKGVKGPPTFGTADLKVGGNPATGVGGEATDVVTIQTSNAQNAFGRILEKDEQATSIIVDLRNSTLQPEDFGNIIQRLRDSNAVNIQSVRFIK